jgi:hypothetical protein
MTVKAIETTLSIADTQRLRGDGAQLTDAQACTLAQRVLTVPNEPPA